MMENSMKTALMTELKKIQFKNCPIPTPADDEVLVKLEYVGVCGSDLHYYEHGRIGDFVVDFPFVLGHEAAGTIQQVGKNVTGLKAGDRVALEPGKTCGRCEFCLTGRYNLCPDVSFFATPPVGGVFQEYVAHQASLCFKLPDSMSTKEGALIEPLAVGFHAALTGEARTGQTAVVTGAGCIGLVSLLALKAMGLSQVFVVDVAPARLEKAMELGATAVIDGRQEDTLARLAELTGGAGPDLAIDTTGSEVVVGQLIQAVKKGSSIVLVGYSASGQMNLPTSVALNKELAIKTIFRYRNIYPLAIETVASGVINLKEIVTNEFHFDDLQSALDQCIHNKTEIVKAVIRMEE